MWIHEFTPGFLVGSVLLTFLVFCFVLLCVFTFWVPCCNVCYDFRIQRTICSSLPPVVCRTAHVLFTLYKKCMFWLRMMVSNTYCVFVLFVLVLCTLYCQFLWIAHFPLPLRYSLTFIELYIIKICRNIIFGVDKI